jgi:carbohydrate kinase (thermoresistant glucokinase family)
MFVYLAGTREVIAARLAARHGHYMPASLLDSQLDTLEPPAPPERYIEVNIDQGSTDIADDIEGRLGLT